MSVQHEISKTVLVTPPAADYVLSRKQVAEILNVSVRTLDRMGPNGPPRIMISERRCGYRASGVAEFLKKTPRSVAGE